MAAELRGRSYNMMNSYVQNRGQPSIEDLFQIAEILEVNVKDLLNSNETNNSEMDKTVKKDWLNDYFSENGTLMSGHPSFAEQFGLSNSISCTIRFIHDYQKANSIFFLTIETTDKKEFENFKSHRNNSALTGLYNLFGKSLIVLFYSKDSFYMYDFGSGGITDTSSELLKEIIKRLNSNLVLSTGSTKQINKTINDTFQQWTRRELTSKCVVNDIDGIFLRNGKCILIELKRVKDRLHEWRPFLDDLPNYKALKVISKSINAEVYLYAYNENQSDHVAFHFHLDTTRWDCIKGKFIVGEPIFFIPGNMGFSYTSTNKRV